MQFKIQSDRTKTVKYRTVKTLVSDNEYEFILTDKYIDNKFKSQSWSVKDGFKKTHPNAYEPEYLNFEYYDDLSFLESDKIDFEFAESSLVTDLESFKGFDHLVCNYLGMDGNIYKINSPDPIPIWRKFDYIGGITQSRFDLDEAEKVINTLKNIRNIVRIRIPHYNADFQGEMGLEFEYKYSTKESMIEKMKEFNIFKDVYLS